MQQWLNPWGKTLKVWTMKPQNTTGNQTHAFETTFKYLSKHANVKICPLERCKVSKIIMNIVYQPSLALPTMKAEKNKKRH